MEEIVSAAERAIAERDANFKHSREALQQLAEVEAALAIQSTPPNSAGLRIISRVFKDVQPEFLGFFATELTKSEKAIALLARAECGHVFFAQHPSAGQDLPSLMKRVFERFNGKGGGPRDFARGKLADPAHAQAAITAARDFLTGETTKEATV